MTVVRKLKTKLKAAATRRKVWKNAKVARDIGKKALKAGLVAGGVVAIQVAARELSARRSVRAG